MGTELSLKIYQELSKAGRKALVRENSPDKGEKVERTWAHSEYSAEGKGKMGKSTTRGICHLVFQAQH